MTSSQSRTRVRVGGERQCIFANRCHASPTGLRPRTRRVERDVLHVARPDDGGTPRGAPSRKIDNDTVSVGASRCQEAARGEIPRIEKRAWRRSCLPRVRYDDTEVMRGGEGEGGLHICFASRDHANDRDALLGARDPQGGIHEVGGRWWFG